MRFLASLLLLPMASAQQYAISTVAGFGLMPWASEGRAAQDSELVTHEPDLISPRGVSADSAGNIYVSDLYYNRVFRISGCLISLP